MTITTPTPRTTAPPTSTTKSTGVRSDRHWSPSVLRLAGQRYRLELRAFRRVKEEMIFTFAFPVGLLTLFATIFGGEIENSGVNVSQYYVAGMLASSGMTVGFQSLSAQLALEQHDGTLKRLAGTPMPKAAYMAGKVGLVCTVAAIQSAIMFIIGVLFFKVTLPDLEGSALLSIVLMLNLAIWTLLGLAFSRLIASPRAGGAVAVPPTLILQFISGVYIFFGDIPPFLRWVASLFPLRWAALGLRQALFPDEFALVEPGGSWQTATMLAVLVGWLGLSAALAGLLFRWGNQE